MPIHTPDSSARAYELQYMPNSIYARSDLPDLPHGVECIACAGLAWHTYMLCECFQQGPNTLHASTYMFCCFEFIHSRRTSTAHGCCDARRCRDGHLVMPCQATTMVRNFHSGRGDFGNAMHRAVIANLAPLKHPSGRL